MKALRSFGAQGSIRFLARSRIIDEFEDRAIGRRARLSSFRRSGARRGRPRGRQGEGRGLRRLPWPAGRSRHGRTSRLWRASSTITSSGSSSISARDGGRTSVMSPIAERSHRQGRPQSRSLFRLAAPTGRADQGPRRRLADRNRQESRRRPSLRGVPHRHFRRRRRRPHHHPPAPRLSDQGPDRLSRARASEHRRRGDERRRRQPDGRRHQGDRRLSGDLQIKPLLTSLAAAGLAFGMGTRRARGARRIHARL